MLESGFINDCTIRKTPVVIYLINGVRLHGTITAHDDKALHFVHNVSEQLVYKHAISTIMIAILKGERS